jgi:hypothetical protein
VILHPNALLHSIRTDAVGWTLSLVAMYWRRWSTRFVVIRGRPTPRWCWRRLSWDHARQILDGVEWWIPKGLPIFLRLHSLMPIFWPFETRTFVENWYVFVQEAFWKLANNRQKQKNLLSQPKFLSKLKFYFMDMTLKNRGNYKRDILLTLYNLLFSNLAVYEYFTQISTL